MFFDPPWSNLIGFDQIWLFLNQFQQKSTKPYIQEHNNMTATERRRREKNWHHFTIIFGALSLVWGGRAAPVTEYFWQTVPGYSHLSSPRGVVGYVEYSQLVPLVHRAKRQLPDSPSPAHPLLECVRTCDWECTRFYVAKPKNPSCTMQIPRFANDYM